MKTIRHIAPPKGDDFYFFIERNLPKSMYVRKDIEGYAEVLTILRQPVPEEKLIETIRRKLFEREIAKVYAYTVRLFHPEFYADFSDLLQKFEREVPGHCCTLEYWEGK